MNDAALAVASPLIQKFESCRLTAYQDSAGRWTIGWGHTGPEVMAGLIWTQAQADLQLAADITDHAAQLCAVSPSVATLVNEQAALIDFVFNEGIGHYEMSTLKKLVDAGNFQQAAQEIQKWVYAGGQRLEGLVRRRAAEAALLFASPSPTPTTA